MSAENHAGSVTQWLQQLDGEHPSEAQERICKRYLEQLARVARRHLSANTRRAADEEDVALSVLDSVFGAVRDGRYPDLQDRHGLWPLLVKMTVCKALKQQRRELAQKRGGGEVRGDSTFHETAEDHRLSFDDFAGTEPFPDTIVELREVTAHLMAQLENDSLRLVAQRKLEGYTNAEIAKELGSGLRTIERKLMRIRSNWTMHSVD